MPYCPECGKRVSPQAKFCRSCGAPQLEEAPPTGTPAVALPASTSCRSCGSPLDPDERFCGNCGAKVGAAFPPSAPPVPAPAPVTSSPPPAPPAVPLPQSSSRPCLVCGNPIHPGDKYCGKCCAIVTEPVSAAPAPVQAPATPLAPIVHPPAQLSPACPSCGSPIAGTEKFCGICGTPVNVTPAPAPAPVTLPPAGKFCASCGAQISATTRFCGGCGAPVVPSEHPPDRQ